MNELEEIFMRIREWFRKNPHTIVTIIALVCYFIGVLTGMGIK